MSRSGRRHRYNELATHALLSHDGAYTISIGPFTISAHPLVFSPKYFPGTLLFAESLPALVQDGAFLEIGVGTGIASLYVAASPLPAPVSVQEPPLLLQAPAAGTDTRTVVGVDINPLAVELTRQNFRANNLAGRFLVSDIFDALEESGERFDCIYWNHPWAWDSEQSEVKGQEGGAGGGAGGGGGGGGGRDQGRGDVMFLDQGYGMLRRFLAQASGYLKEGGSVILGTSEYADLKTMEGLYEEEGYASEVVARREDDIGDGMVEVLYLIRLKPVSGSDGQVQMKASHEGLYM